MEIEKSLETGVDTRAHTDGRGRRSLWGREFEENLKSEEARSADFFVVLADSCEDRVLFGHIGLLVERALARQPRTGRCTCG